MGPKSFSWVIQAWSIWAGEVVGEAKWVNYPLIPLFWMVQKYGFISRIHRPKDGTLGFQAKPLFHYPTHPQIHPVWILSETPSLEMLVCLGLWTELIPPSATWETCKVYQDPDGWTLFGCWL